MTYVKWLQHPDKWPHWQKVHLSNYAIIFLRVLQDCSMCGRLSHSRELQLHLAHKNRSPNIQRQKSPHGSANTHQITQIEFPQTHMDAGCKLQQHSFLVVNVCVCNWGWPCCVHLSFHPSVSRARLDHDWPVLQPAVEFPSGEILMCPWTFPLASRSVQNTTFKHKISYDPTGTL